MITGNETNLKTTEKCESEGNTRNRPTDHTRVNLEGYKKMRGVGGLLNLCQGGTCICDHQQNTVLYCYGEVRFYISTNLLLPHAPLIGGVEEASSARW